MPRKIVLAACLSILLPASAMADDDLYRLPVGDPARSQRQSPVVLDGITDTRSDEILGPDELAVALRDAQILFVGEEHTSMDFHIVQARVIRALHDDGRNVMVGLEMLPYSKQKILDRWIRGRYSEDEFLERVAWDEHWSYHWQYYRDIFLFAREQRLPMVGINAPREVIKRVRLDGFDELGAEDARHIPTTVDTGSEQHMRLFRAYFSAEDEIHSSRLTDDQWAGMFRAQCTWDAVMGYNAMQAVKESRARNPIIVVLIGAGHVTYGLGAERQIADEFDGGIASLMPVPVADLDGEPVEAVQSSYADFIWGVPGAREPLYPVLGASMAGSLGNEPTKIIQVETPSVAERAGLRVGDILRAIDGKPVESALDVRRATNVMRWGDRAIARVQRGENEISVELEFRRR